MPDTRSRDRRLTEDEILEVALRVIEAEGMDRLSMRRLAQELGVTPMAIYRYVGNKDDLVQRVANRVLRGVKGDSSQRWQDYLLDNGIAVWEVLSPYPGLAGFVLNRPLSPQARRRVDDMVLALERAGFDRSTAEMAYEAYHTYIYGLVALESRFRAGRHAAARLRRVEFGLRVWIAGLEVQLLSADDVHPSRGGAKSSTTGLPTKEARQPAS
jgi:AcrR family transcriptional regulator